MLPHSHRVSWLGPPSGWSHGATTGTTLKLPYFALGANYSQKGDDMQVSDFIKTRNVSDRLRHVYLRSDCFFSK